MGAIKLERLNWIGVAIVIIDLNQHIGHCYLICKPIMYKPNDIKGLEPGEIAIANNNYYYTFINVMDCCEDGTLIQFSANKFFTSMCNSYHVKLNIELYDI